MRWLLYTLILTVVTACGCSAPAAGELDAARRIMADNPREALSRLNGMDVSEFSDSATMAQWALLYSEAMAANRLSPPTDTIVDIAIDYYGRHNRTAEFQRASRLKELLRSAGSSDQLATALYLQKEKEFLLYKERVRRGVYLWCFVAILLLAAGVIVWMRQRIRLQAARNDALMAEAAALQCRIEAGSGEVGRLEAKLHGLLEKRFALIDSLCQTYYEAQGTKAERKAVIDKVRSAIESVRTDSFSDMEQAVNDCRGNLLGRVRASYPALKPDDYQLLVYIASGLSARTVSLLVGESSDVVYKRKSRLKSRLREFAASSCPDVMDVF